MTHGLRAGIGIGVDNFFTNVVNMLCLDACLSACMTLNCTNNHFSLMSDQTGCQITA